MGPFCRGELQKMKSLLLVIASLAFFGSVAKAGIFSSCNGKTVPQGSCALLYDDDDCSGWKYEVPIGYKELPRFSVGGPRKDDAESVLVRQGCKFIGYSDDGQRGDTVVVDNLRSTKPLSKNFKTRADLDERIESMFCSCNR